jgi:hypothetical protein
MDQFETIQKYDKKHEKIFNLLSIDGNYHVIGSASLKGNRYRNDYDLNGLFKSNGKKDVIEKYLYKVFLNKFNDAYKNDNVWITDFKCGMNNNDEPLRWSYNDMKKGFKMMSNGRKILFTECLLQKTTMKMDIVSIVDEIGRASCRERV